MILETTSRLSGGQVPQAQGLVPGSGQGVVAVRGEHDVADEVRVAVQTLLGYAVVVLVAGQLPDNQGLVCGGKTKRINIEQFVAHQLPKRFFRNTTG